MYMDFGKEIKAARAKMHMTQKELAERIGKTVSSVRKYESGQTIPPFDVLMKIAEVLPLDMILRADFGDGEKDYHMDMFGAYAEFLPTPTKRQVNLNRISSNEKLLNTTGIEKLADYSSDLVQSGNYKRSSEDE